MEQDKTPLVTIAMPVYNAGRYLRLAVVSIIQQTFTDWELLVIDDGSTDGAVDTIRDLSDARIRIIHDGANKGLAARLNEAIDMARGRYFARMDQDDISYPERLGCQVSVLESAPDIDLTSVRCVAIDAENDLVGALPFRLSHEEICAIPAQGFYMPHPSWMGRLDWFRQHRYARPGPYFCEDQELLLRSYPESRFLTIPEVLFAYRVRSRIDWSKSLKTRKAVLGIQLRFFSARKQWQHYVLSLLTFSARVTVDFFNAQIQKMSFSGIQRYHALTLEPNESNQWDAVKANLLHSQ